MSVAPRASTSHKGHWLLGNVPQMRAAPHSFVADTAREAGGVAPLRVGLGRWLAVSDPLLIREVLIKRHATYERSFHYNTGAIVVGPGLLQVDGPRWLRRRRQMLPFFRGGRMEKVAAATEAAVMEIIRSWATLPPGTAVDAAKAGDRLTLSVIMRTVLSEEIEPGEVARFAALTHRALAAVQRRNNGISLPLGIPTAGNRALRQAREQMEERFASHVAARRAGATGADDFLDALVFIEEDGRPLAEADVAAEVKTLLLAGFETTATTFAWAMYLLAAAPAVQDEIVSALAPASDGTMPRAQEIPLVMATVRETMRLYPAVYNLGRVALEGDTLGHHTVRRGTVVLLSIWAAHRDPAYWPEPDRFDPNRFMNGGSENPAFMPFAIGKHICIGASFAETELAVAIAAVLKRFRVRRAEGVPLGIAPRVTLAPDGPVHLLLDPR